MRRITAPAVLLPLLTGSAVGCGDADGARHSAMGRDSAGIRIVESAAPAWGPGEEWRLADSPRVEIGVTDGDPAYLFDRIAAARRLPDGRFLVLDGGSRELRFYDADGGWLQSTGGPGGGPGEFESLDGVVPTGHSLWVFDRGLGRMTVLELDGAYARSFRLDPTGDPARPLGLYRLAGFLSDSAFVLVPTAFPADMRPEPTIYWDAVENLLYARRGTLLDSIGPPSGMEIEAGVRPDGRRFAGDRPFGRISANAVGDSLLFHSDAERLEIRAYDGRDRLRRISRVFIRPPAVTGDRWLEIVGRRLADGSIPPDRAATLRRELLDADLPDTEPAHGSAMVVAEDGHLWVQRYAHPWEGGRPPGWHVFDPEGRWLGTVDPPRRTDIRSFEIHQAGPGGVLAVWQDTFGVERVGMWGVDRP